MNFLKKLFNTRNITILVIVLSIIGIIIWRRSSKDDNAEYITQTVTKGDLVQTVTATGSVKAASEISLSFKADGTIIILPFSVNDQVKKGELIARLDDSDLRIRVSEYKARVDAERARMNKLKAGTTEERIKISQEQINNAKILFNAAKESYIKLEEQFKANIKKAQTDIKNAQDSLATTRNRKEILLNSQDNEINNAKESAITTLDNTYYSLDNVIDSINIVLTDDRLYNMPLGIQSPGSYQAVLSDINLADNNTSNLKPVIDSLQPSSDSYAINTTINSASLLLNDMNAILSNLLRVFDNSIPTPEVNEEIINSFKSQLTALQTNVSLSRTNLNIAKSTMVTKVESYNQQLANIESEITNYLNAIATNQSMLEQEITRQNKSIKDAQTEIDRAQGNVNLAMRQHEDTTAPVQQYDIDLQQAMINQAQASLNLAVNNLKNTQIISPIDGIIVKLPYDIGEKVPISQPAVVLETLSNFELEADVAESDISLVKLNDKAEVTFDAYGEDVIIKSQIINIEPSETLIQDIIYYRIKLDLVDLPVKIKSGLSADVTIYTASRKDILYISQRAVITNDKGQKIVRILHQNEKDTEVEERLVTTGLRGDGGLLEITSGIDEGEEVITLIKNGK